MDSLHKRDIILQRRGRQPTAGVDYEDANKSISDLEKAVFAVDDGNGLIAEFVPIRLVTILEVFIRNVIELLLYADDEKKRRAQALLKSIKFDFLLTEALESGQLTLASIDAHEVHIQTLPAIVHIFDVLLADDFWEVMQQTRLVIAEDDGSFVQEPIIEDIDALKKELTRLFEVRHVLTHELPHSKAVNRDDIKRMIEASRKFVTALGQIQQDNEWWNNPRNIAEYEEQMRGFLAESQSKLNDAVQQLIAFDQSCRELVEKAQNAWQQFIGHQAELEADRNEPWCREVARLVNLTHATDTRHAEIVSMLQEWRLNST